MKETVIQPNPKADLKLKRVGIEQTPVIIIDDFAVETVAIRDAAQRAIDYGPDPHSAYPGLRTNLPREYYVPVLNSIYKLLYKAYAVPQELAMRPVNTVYSLITTAEPDLILSQRVPHFDSTDPFYLAILHYLAEGDYCDTGLFRHRPTGFERIGKARLDSFIKSSAAFQAQHGEPAPAYIKDSNEHFELFDRIEYCPNRLVVYPGNLLHSGLVNPAKDIDPNPATGRLTANIFVNFAPAKTRQDHV